jgi:hypothetical protein
MSQGFTGTHADHPDHDVLRRRKAVYDDPPPPEFMPATDAVDTIQPPVLRSKGSAGFVPGIFNGCRNSSAKPLLKPVLLRYSACRLTPPRAARLGHRCGLRGHEGDRRGRDGLHRKPPRRTPRRDGQDRPHPLAPLFAGADWVFHLATLADIVSSMEQPIDHRPNLDGALRVRGLGWPVLDQMREAGFADPRALLCWSPERGYLGGDQVLFLASRADHEEASC